MTLAEACDFGNTQIKYSKFHKTDQNYGKMVTRQNRQPK